MIQKRKTLNIGIEPTIADNKIGNFQWSADKNNQYLETPLFDSIYKVKNDEIKKKVLKKQLENHLIKVKVIMLQMIH